jgi:hypothetical protein
MGTKKVPPHRRGAAPPPTVAPSPSQPPQPAAKPKLAAAEKERFAPSRRSQESDVHCTRKRDAGEETDGPADAVVRRAPTHGGCGGRSAFDCASSSMYSTREKTEAIHGPGFANHGYTGWAYWTGLGRLHSPRPGPQKEQVRMADGKSSFIGSLNFRRSPGLLPQF